MNDFIIYALKSILALGLFAGVYRFILLNELNFSVRRMYLLLSVCLALILPLFTFSFPVINSSLQNMLLDEIIVYSNGIRLIRETSTFPWTQFLKLLYFCVTGFLLTRILWDITRITRMTIRQYPEQIEQIKLFLLKDKNISYSFFRNVFIGEATDSEDIEKIYAHEKVHASQLHSIDVIGIELLSCFFWFNPMIWWFRNEIRNVHEYLADQGALDTGFNIKKYQITILEHLIGSASITITNSFNYSLIKNRIAMMNKEKSNKKNIWKVFMLIPVSLAIAFAFACTQKSTDLIANQDTEQNSQTTAYIDADQMPAYPGGFEALSKFIAKNITYPKEALENNVSGKVIVQFIIDKTGAIVTDTNQYMVSGDSKGEKSLNGGITVADFKPAAGSPTENVGQYVDLLKKEAIRVVSLIPAFEQPGMKDGKAVPVIFTIPINFALK